MIKQKRKRLVVRWRSTPLRLAAGLYAALISIDYLLRIGLVGSLFWGLLIFLKAGIPTTISEFKGLASPLAILGVLLFLYLCIRTLKDNLEPETVFERDGILLAAWWLHLPILTETQTCRGEVILSRKRNHLVSSGFRLNLDTGEELYIVTEKGEQLPSVGEEVLVRRSILKLPGFGWCNHKLRVSILDETGQSRYKYEAEKPYEIKTKRRVLFG